MSFGFAENTRNPPYFGQTEWIVDPLKIVQRKAVQTLPTIMEEEEECIPVQPNTNIISTVSTKRVRFSPFVVVHGGSQGRITQHLEPMQFTRARLDTADDEIFILNRKVDQLTRELTRKNKKIQGYRDVQNILLLIILVLTFITFIYYGLHNNMFN